MKVYILSEHEEHGARNVMATTEPDKLLSMMVKFYGGEPFRYGEPEALSKLASEGYPIDPDGHYLSTAWGGIMLHIVELQ